MLQQFIKKISSLKVCHLYGKLDVHQLSQLIASAVLSKRGKKYTRADILEYSQTTEAYDTFDHLLITKPPLHHLSSCYKCF